MTVLCKAYLISLTLCHLSVAFAFFSLQLCSDNDKVKVSTVSLGVTVSVPMNKQRMSSGTLSREKWCLYHSGLLDFITQFLILQFLFKSAASDAHTNVLANCLS